MSIVLNGSSQYAIRTGAPMTAPPLAMSCWFKTTNTTGDLCLMSLGTSNASYGYHCILLALRGGKVIAIQYDGGFKTSATSTSYTSGAWQHACAIFQATNDRRAYLNGGGVVPNTAASSVGGIGRFAAGVIYYMSGSGSDAFDWKFPGSLAEISLWDLTAIGADTFVSTYLPLLQNRTPNLVYPSGLLPCIPCGGPVNTDDTNDKVGSYNLTQAGSPSFAADHPAIAQYVGSLEATTRKSVFSLSGTASVPVFTGTLAATARKAACALQGTVAAPVYTGTLAATVRKAACVLSGTVSVPVYSGSLAATAKKATCVLSGTVTAPVCTGSLAATVRRAACALAGTVSSPASSPIMYYLSS